MPNASDFCHTLIFNAPEKNEKMKNKTKQTKMEMKIKNKKMPKITTKKVNV